MKIKFRGHGPNTDWKMVEMTYEFPCRIDKDDTLRIAGTFHFSEDPDYALKRAIEWVDNKTK